MDNMKFVEDASISGTKITEDGYLVGRVKCARTGIQDYAGYECGMPDKAVVRVFRPEDEVFSEKSMSTYAGKPATNDHPSTKVTADNWKKHSVGQVGTKILRDGEFVDVPFMLMDAEAIMDVQGGKRGVSMGYECSFHIEEGTTPDGQAYDAVMRGLRMNHLAIVDKGRAGPSVRIGDNWGATPITTTEGKPPMTLKTTVVDGLTVETTDAGIKAIEKLQNEAKALQDAAAAVQSTSDAAIASAQAAHDAAMITKDGELATKDAEIAELKKQILTGDALDAMVAARSEMVAKVRAFNKDAEIKGKSDTQIKSIAVDAVHGEGFSADKAPAYIDVAFDLLKMPEGDKVRDALKSKTPETVAANDNGYADYVSRLNNAYKTQGV